MNETQTLKHRSAESFDQDNRWCTPCTCGKRFTGNSPSLAFGRWKKHADAENPKTPTDRPTTPPARIRVCGCGCGEPLAPKAGGLFRSGHDARFKSALTVAHAEGRPVRHPATGEPTTAMNIADWLDERRGSGTFWRDKVLAGHKPAPARTERPAAAEKVDPAIRAKVRVDMLMEAIATRRPASGDVGVVTLRSGKSHGAQVLRRNGEDSLQIRLLDGPETGKAIVVGDVKFAKAVK